MTEYYEHPTYEFAQTDIDGNEISMSFSAESLPEICGKFVDFLKGAGFSYVSGLSVLSKGSETNPANWNYHFDNWGEYEHPPMDDMINKIAEKVADE